MLVQDLNMNLTRYAFAMTLLILLDGNFLQHFWLLSSMNSLSTLQRFFIGKDTRSFPDGSCMKSLSEFRIMNVFCILIETLFLGKEQFCNKQNKQKPIHFCIYLDIICHLFQMTRMYRLLFILFINKLHSRSNNFKQFYR